MNTSITAVKLIAFAGPVISAIRIDLGAFQKAREADHTAKFDWALAITRWSEGALYGIAAALGIGSLGQ